MIAVHKLFERKFYENKFIRTEYFQNGIATVKTHVTLTPIFLGIGAAIFLVSAVYAAMLGGIQENLVPLVILWTPAILFVLSVYETRINTEEKTLQSRIGIRFWSSRKSLPFSKVTGIRVSKTLNRNTTQYSAHLHIEDISFPSIIISSDPSFGIVAKAAQQASMLFDCPIMEDDEIKSLRDDLGEPLV